MYTFQRVALDNISDSDLYGFSGKYIFTTREWLSFVEETQGGESAILRIMQNSRPIGFLYGRIISKFGVRIFGSPFSGWSTCYMGLDLQEGDKLSVIKEATTYIVRELGCLYAEIIDRDVSVEDAEKAGLKAFPIDTLQLDFSKNESDADLMSHYKTKCRNTIRQFEKRGASLEIVEHPDDAFVDEYYDQLIDVFAKQGLVPTYNKERVLALVRHLRSTDNLLCLRVRDPEGLSIATSIFFGYGSTFYFWGGASYRSGQKYLPNEYMLWTANRHFRDKGMTSFDMVGVRDYKRKFGSEERVYAKVVFARYAWLLPLRDLAQKCFFLLLRLKGFIQRKR
ncbi:MAG: GNAT family N-acetyltransferase [Clostridia bacterium]|nr:GNAT family N-acetyltransferase [Clostridia bacterium]